MILKNNLFKSEAGAVSVFVVLISGILLGVLGLTVDLGRYYVIRGKAQNAADTALTGALANRMMQDPVETAKKLFQANFPNDYSGSNFQGYNFTQDNPGVYTLTAQVSVQPLIMQIFGAGADIINVSATANIGYGLVPQKSLELALVIDNSMSTDTGGIANAGITMMNALYEKSIGNVFTSIVPFDTAINMHLKHIDWIQPDYAVQFELYRNLKGGNELYFANRNSDSPQNALLDVNDDPPLTDDQRFRVPAGYGAAGIYNTGKSLDFVSDTQTLSAITFATTDVNTTTSALNSMTPTGANRRVNVGLMWGWFMLSGKWQGMFDAGVPNLPQPANAGVSKHMVLVITGRNNVFPEPYFLSKYHHNDDVMSIELCNAIKAAGITLHVVSYQEPIWNNVSGCGINPDYSDGVLRASTPTELNTAFRKLTDQILYPTIHVVE